VSPATSPASPAPHSTRVRLGEILIRRGLITSDQLAHALARQPDLRQRIGRIVVALQYATDEAVQRAVAERHGVPYLDLDRVAIDRTLARIINRTYARRHRLLPVARHGATLVVAMVEPEAPGVADDLRRLTGQAVDVVTASEVAMQRAFRRLYEEVTEAGPLPVEAEDPGDDAPGAGHRADELLRRLLRHAVEARCSDLHLEMLPEGLSIRYRVDGVLRPPHFGALHDPLDRGAREIVSRIKVLCRLDIAERRRPQDGSFRFSLDAASAPSDLRVSIIPTHTGESVVLRLLDATRAPQSLEELDVSPSIARGLDRVLTRTSGMFLVTGPTGSGKSTTLYACLRRLHQPEIRILTAEDPVEYVYDGLSQCEVNDDIGNTFARYLRSFLRHDPEVIMVGEIRDEDTAQMAFRAAQTGHFLLSTLHTSSAVAALPRLLDLGIAPSLVAASLAGVMSQRLVRRLCGDCRQPAPPAPDLVSEFFGSAASAAGVEFFRASGCPACGFTGYRGRLIVADLWIPDEADAALIARGAALDDVRRSAVRTTSGMGADAIVRLRAGSTTMEELRRVLPQGQP
jgi:type IV pilus assembly protein PilB